MTLTRPFIDQIKLLFRSLINDKDVALNRPPSYEVEIMPSSMHSGSQPTPLSGAGAVKTGATVAVLRVPARASRLWSVNQDSSWYVEHTRSNLG